MKLSFFIGVYQQTGLASTRILKLREFYPDAAIVSISDGVDNKDYATFCAQHNVTYTLGDRLKLMASGGKWTERFLKALLATSADLLIKIDPDTGVNSPLDLNHLPTTDLFGNIRVTGNRTYIQGGFIAFTRAAATRIIASNLLGSTEYCTHAYAYPRYKAPYLQQGETPSEEWFTSEDAILWDVVQKLKLSVGEFDQVACYYRDLPAGSDQKFAFTHPNLIDQP